MFRPSGADHPAWRACTSRSKRTGSWRARVAQRRTIRGRTGGEARQVFDPHFVLEVVLIEQCTLEQAEIPIHPGPHSTFEFPPLIVLGDDRIDADPLRQLEELGVSRVALEMVEDCAQRRRVLHPFLVSHDRQTEGHGEHNLPDGVIGCRDKVLERGQHAVTRAPLGLGVQLRVIEAGATHQLARPAPQSAPRVRLPRALGDPRHVLIDIAPAVRPAHIVQEEHWSWCTGRSGGLDEQAQLVRHRVPVVISVDECDVGGRERGQDVETVRSVDEVSAGGLSLRCTTRV